MKLLLLILVFFTLGFTGELSAQQKLSDKIAPNVVITDIDGYEHQLYDILADGKSVVIHFFATWCGPCWDYHESGQLQSIWNTYGPAGSDELAIFFIEADPGTTNSDLHQATTNSYGDYVTDSPYPVAEDSELANIFEIAQFPSVFYICPDKKVSEVGHLTLGSTQTHLNETCAVPSLENNLELLFYTNDLNPACKSQEVLPTVMVQNIGTNTIKEISCQLKMNGQPWGTPLNWDVWLNTYETLELAFGPFELNQSTEFSIDIVEVNGSKDPDPEHNTITSSKEWPITDAADVTLVLNTDDFGPETSWELWDEYGNILASGDGYYSNSTVTENIHLINLGCYELKVFDSYGDGMCCNYSDGSYQLLDAYQNVLLSGGRFLKEDSGSFEYSNNWTATSSIPMDELLFSVYPNPAIDELHISKRNGNQPYHIQISDAAGSTLINQTMMANENIIDISSFAPGVYFLSMSNEKSTGVQAFVVGR